MTWCTLEIPAEEEDQQKWRERERDQEMDQVTSTWPQVEE